MTTTPGPLLSDHVNYLIFRYLQECGHEATARSFYNDWYRPSEYRDPEELPFAGSVRRAALVSVIQDGIRYDELQGRTVKDAPRRHVWSQLSVRHTFPPKPSFGTGIDPSAVKRKSIGVVGPHDDAQPTLKRQKTAPEDTRVNGHRDAMDLDERSPSAADEEDDGEAISPALASEPDLPATRYDSVATQTDGLKQQRPPRQGFEARSLRFTIDKPRAKLFHTAWSPSKTSKDRRTLLTAGDGLCRLYRLPENLADDVANVPHIDEPRVPDDAMVTAVAWHPSGTTVTCAVESVSDEDPLDKLQTTRVLLDIGPGATGSTPHGHDGSLLQPPGVVLNIEYSPSGEHLLVASTNTTRSLVEVWATAKSNSELRRDPIAWCFFEQELTDVAWCEDLQIRACTASNRAHILMLPEELEAVSEFDSSTVRKHNLIEEVLPLPCNARDVSINYRYDDSHWLDLYFVQDITSQSPNKMIVLDLKHHDATNNETPLTFELARDFVAATLQPTRDNINGEVKSPSASTRLLATVFESGDCQIYELGRSDDKMTCQPLFTASDKSLAMSHGPVLAASWSPNGALLALAGDDQVQIWDTTRTDTGLLDERPLLIWRADEPELESAEQVNGIKHEESGSVRLSWDALGEKLCFVVDDKVSIIEIDQRAAADREVVMTNGE